MKLADLANAISTTRENFDLWVNETENELFDFFYGLDGTQLNNLDFLNFFVSEIQSSAVYKEYHRHRNLTPPFEKFLACMSAAAEKLSEIGLDHLAKTIVSDLPVSAHKHRLFALNEFTLVEDVRKDFVEKLPHVLAHLNRSRLADEEENLRPVIDILAFFYQRVCTKAKEHNISKIIDDIKKMFQDNDTIEKYPFLGHQVLQDIIEGKKPFELIGTPIAKDCLRPSEIIKGLFFKFNSAYYGNPNIKLDKLWGHSKVYILDNILVRGRGDFTRSTGDISADDKVMLYCFFNMKKHFFTSYAVFQDVVTSLGKFFDHAEYKPVFIDLGCGPMTSGLALADLIHTTYYKPISMSYIGIDISNSMLNKAGEFTEMAIFSANCSFDFYNNWNDLSPQKLKSLAGKNNPIIFNASYLFAADKLNEDDLANYIQKVARIYANVYLIFQNPHRDDRNLKYKRFKQQIATETVLQGTPTVRYKAAQTESSEYFEYEILKIKGG